MVKSSLRYLEVFRHCRFYIINTCTNLLEGKHSEPIVSLSQQSMGLQRTSQPFCLDHNRETAIKR